MNALAPSAVAAMELEQGPSTIKAKKVSGLDKSAKLFLNKEELYAQIEDTYATNEHSRKRFDDFWDALAVNPDFYLKKTPPKHGQQLDYPSLFHTAIHTMSVQSSDPLTGNVFTTRNGTIKSHNGELQFIAALDPAKSKEGKPVKKKMTFEDAFNVIFLAATDRTMIHPNKLLIEGGSRAERIMYMRAIAAYNQTVPAELRFEIAKSPLLIPATISPATNEFQNYMHRAKPMQIEPPDSKENPDIIKEESASTALSPEERHAYMTAKLDAIEQYITENEKEILKQPPVDKTGGTPTRNVYLIQMEGYPNDATYVAKIGGTLRVIFSKDDNNIGLVRHNDVYMQNHMDHPKHPMHRGLNTAAQMAKESQGVDLSNFNISASYNLPEGSYGPITNLADIANGKNISAKAMQRTAKLAKEFAGVDTSDLKISTTFTLPEGSYGPIKSFQDAAAPATARRNTARAIKAAAALDAAVLKPTGMG